MKITTVFLINAFICGLMSTTFAAPPANSHLLCSEGEGTKPLDKGQGMVCVLNDSCDEPKYKNICAICTDHLIPITKVDNSNKLGEWSGLCKIDKAGKPRKVVGCSCIVTKQ